MSMAVVTLCRPTTGLIPLMLPLVLPWGWPLKQRVGLCLAYGLTMVAVIAPWTYHNWRTYHRFLPWTAPAGAFWQGSPEFYHLLQQMRHYYQVWLQELDPKHSGGHDAYTIEGHRYFIQRALRSSWAEPGVYLTYALQKAGYLWLGNPTVEWAYGHLYNGRLSLCEGLLEWLPPQFQPRACARG
jgi:hypothetical protein